MELPAASGGESIKVFVRVRPPDPNLESDLDRSVCLDVTSQSSLTVHCKPEPKVFTFDHVAAMHTTQEDVFTSVGRPIIDSCMCGYNGTVFAYGQTGSGKTFTMIGPSDDSNNFTHELRGIIPRSFEYLFSLINREKQKYGELVDFLCKCSFLEIYNEQVYDLVDPASCGLHLRENIKHGVYVDGLLETSVASAREAYEVLSTGWANRRVAATSMNRESSRSHAVFTLTVESKKREGKDSVAKLKSSVLNLVDLAGSERQRDTQTAGVRLKEAGSINKSLSALGNVIMALVDIAHGKSRHVHYRDSKLTFLLRDSLGGNAKTNLVANVHPNARCFGESLSTLNFARRAKMIKNKAVVNEDATGNVLQLQAEIRRLKEQLEKFRAGTREFPLSSTSLPVSSLDYITRDGLRSDDEKAIQELKEMLASSMTARDKTDKDQAMLLDRVENLQKLCKQKDSFLQSTKMILKFRETHIANLEKAKQSETSADLDQQAAISLLKQEIDQLKYMVNHHPDVSKFAHETIDLKAEIKRLQGVASGGQNLSRDLARTHKYTLQLERQLRHFLGKGDGSSSSDSSSLKRPSPSSSHSNTIHLEARCKQLQGELDRTRKSLNSEREDFHIRETKLEASLTATKKANLELERSIEALKLKNSVEKATLNDVHMNTIKSMLTPRRDLIQARRSVSSTSFGMHRADSDPLNNQQFSLSFNGAISTPTRPITIVDTPNRLEKKHDISSLTTNPRLLALHEANRVQSLDNGGVPSGGFSTPRMTKEVVVNDEGEELNIEGALTDELKIVQDKNRHLQQQIEDLELKVFRLSQDKTSLEVQLKELTQLYHSEHETMQTREHDYLDKISDLTSQIATLTSNTTVLDSEVVDLRICLRSADKEIAELKSDRKEQRHTQEVKFMEHMQRIAELEQLVSTQAAGWDRSTEELQNLQDEVETLREELTFKDHRLTELGQVAVREKEQGGALEKEVQGLLEKLASEVEKNTRLSCELQEGSQGKEELVAMVSENSKLKSEVEQLETELRSQLTTYKQELEKAEVTINSLMTRQSSDEAAITGFMTTVQELRGACATSEAKAISLSKEVEDSNNELSSAAVKIDQLTSELTTLRTQLSEQAFHHERQLRKNDTEHEVILDDLDRLNEQYQQLQEVFGTQSKCLKEAQCETQRLQEDLTEKDTELARIHLQQREKRESLTRIQPAEKDWAFTVEEKTEEIEELKQKLDHAAEMINMYEAGREEKNKELQTLKDELTSVEHVGEENRNLHAQLTTLQYKLSFTEDHLQKTEEHLREEFQEGLARVEQLEKDYTSAVQAKDKARRESTNLQDKCQGQRNSIDALTQQLARYKTHEEALFLEKESLRSQLEAIQEEQSKLSKECEKLAKENAAITGHQNIRQKIQYHATVKIENSKLKEEVIQLRSRLKRKNDQVAQLHQLLTEKETQPPSDGGKNTVSNRKMLSSQKTFSDSEMAVKENLSPF